MLVTIPKLQAGHLVGLRVYLGLLLVACSCTILVWNWLLSHCGLAVMQTCALRDPPVFPDP